VGRSNFITQAAQHKPIIIVPDRHVRQRLYQSIELRAALG
jgi:hypothetical protein